jgi:hypothetical protein
LYGPAGRFTYNGGSRPGQYVNDAFGLELTAATNFQTARGKIFKTSVDKLW